MESYPANALELGVAWKSCTPRTYGPVGDAAWLSVLQFVRLCFDLQALARETNLKDLGLAGDVANVSGFTLLPRLRGCALLFVRSRGRRGKRGERAGQRKDNEKCLKDRNDAHDIIPFRTKLAVGPANYI